MQPADTDLPQVSNVTSRHWSASSSSSHLAGHSVNSKKESRILPVPQGLWINLENKLVSERMSGQ